MKQAFLIALIAFSAMSMNKSETFHDFVVQDINGKDFDFSQLKGKKVLVVNTASKCGFTPQYEGLQNLYEKYKDQDFTIIGFPANNFMNQEPGTDEEIKSFCSANYGVTFPMMSKISVKGNDIHPVYQWLTMESKNGKMDSKVKWNFQKYLINQDGSLHAVVGTKTKPMSEVITNWIEN